MKAAVVMDTNVAVVANGRTPQAGDKCVETCVATLIEMRDHRRVLLDDQGLILDEYRRRLSPSGQPGPGDAFFKWLWDNQGHQDHCRQIPITPANGSRGFEEFPDDPDLERFDRADRKFVAVALASEERPPILNASDTDWWVHRAALNRHGVEIRFLCPELMKGKR
ncbi:MAG TPA: hypothetical protein VIA62_02145 [Thermoanaerobaculia bacterium]|nr:hypothetical protein [Thermoanaerobaculia bacterium]